MKNKKDTVGQKVVDILKKEKHAYEVQEIIDEYAQSYTDEVQKCVQENWEKFEDPFYVVVLHKKEPWALNVLRSWFIARQTKPLASTMWKEYKNFMHTVYRIHKKEEKVELLYTLPSPAEAKTIVQNWHLYDPNLVRWCHSAMTEAI